MQCRGKSQSGARFVWFSGRFVNCWTVFVFSISRGAWPSILSVVWEYSRRHIDHCWRFVQRVAYWRRDVEQWNFNSSQLLPLTFFSSAGSVIHPPCHLIAYFITLPDDQFRRRFDSFFFFLLLLFFFFFSFFLIPFLVLNLPWCCF